MFISVLAIGLVSYVSAFVFSLLLFGDAIFLYVLWRVTNEFLINFTSDIPHFAKEDELKFQVVLLGQRAVIIFAQQAWSVRDALIKHMVLKMLLLVIPSSFLGCYLLDIYGKQPQIRIAVGLILLAFSISHFAILKWRKRQENLLMKEKEKQQEEKASPPPVDEISTREQIAWLIAAPFSAFGGGFVSLGVPPYLLVILLLQVPKERARGILPFVLETIWICRTIYDFFFSSLVSSSSPSNSATFLRWEYSCAFIISGVVAVYIGSHFERLVTGELYQRLVSFLLFIVAISLSELAPAWALLVLMLVFVGVEWWNRDSN